MARLQIVIVEDEPAHVAAIRRALNLATVDAYIHVAGTLSDYRALLDTVVPDMALVDLILPDGSAMEVLHTPPETGPCPILVMTSYGDQRTAVEALRSGALDYFVKSADAFASVPHLIDRALREWSLLRERTRADACLRQREEEYRTILQTAQDGFLLMDAAGGILDVNEAYCRMSGYNRDELLEMSLAGVEATMSPADIEQHIADVMERGPARFETTHRCKEGRLIYFEASTNCLGDRSRLFAFLHDTTERKRREQEREKLQAQLLQAQKMESVGRLAGGLAHDFNNLLTVIKGYSEMMMEAVEPDNLWLSPIEEIHKAGERATGLVAQLLAFSRRQVLRPQAINLNAVVGDLEKMLLRLVGEDIEIVLALGAALGYVMADRHQIEQVLMNLVVNSRDAMPQGGQLVIETANGSPDSVLGPEDPVRVRHHVRLSVRDTGIGMDEQTRQHLFEPFYTTKPAGKGTGLGLATVHGIVMQSGGSIGLESEPGRGTVIHIYFPACKGAPESSPGTGTSRPAGGSETVLLVEDETEVRHFVAAVLARYGYRVLPAAGGEEALAECAHGPIDLLLTDIVMPRMNGVELAARARAIRPGLKTLFMSGYSDEVHERHREHISGQAFLQKPFSPDALAAKVREALDTPVPRAAD